MSKLDEIRTIEQEAERLYAEAEVEAALDRMAAEIAARLETRNPLVLTVLNGGIVFAGKLLPRLRFPLELDAIHATRYRGETSGGHLHWLLEPQTPLTGRTVLIADDVLDEGITLAAIVQWCKHRGAREVYTAVLVDKQIGRERPHRADFVGLETENRYLFGYGMDYKDYLRNAPGIFACKS
jgi:hypoxanthine phosphoribosyltransferase